MKLQRTSVTQRHRHNAFSTSTKGHLPKTKDMVPMPTHLRGCFRPPSACYRNLRKLNDDAPKHSNNLRVSSPTAPTLTAPDTSNLTPTLTPTAHSNNLYCSIKCYYAVKGNLWAELKFKLKKSSRLKITSLQLTSRSVGTFPFS